MSSSSITAHVHNLGRHRAEFAIVCLRYFADTHGVASNDLATMIESAITEVLATWAKVYSEPTKDRQIPVKIVPPTLEELSRSQDILDTLFREYRISTASIEHFVFDIFTVLESIIPRFGLAPDLSVRLVAEIGNVPESRREIHATMRRSLPH